MAEYIEKEGIRKSISFFFDIRWKITQSPIELKQAVLEVIDGERAADVQPINRWISVEDRLPNQDEKVLVLTKDRDIMTMIYKVTPFRWYKPNFGGFDKDFVMYWQPFPELPKDGDTI